MSDDWGNDPIVTSTAPAQPEATASDWGNDPVAGSKTYKFSDQAINDAAKKPGGKVVMMSPDTYLALTPEMTPRTAKADKKARDLQKSLDNGEEINEVPSLDVKVGQDGTAKIIDQDGRHRALFAKEHGLEAIPVLVDGLGKIDPKSLTGMRDDSEPVPFDFKSAPLPPEKPGMIARAIDTVKNAVYVPSDKREDKTLSEAVNKGYQGIPEEIGKQFSQGLQDFKDVLPTTPMKALKFFSNPLADAAPSVEMALSPLTGALTSAVGRPVEQATGIKREVTGNVLSALVPLGGEAKVASKVGDIAKGAEDIAAGSNALMGVAGDANHAAKVQRLQEEGIEPTLGQIKGGSIRRFEEGHKSDPLVGQAIRDQESHALDTFNRALYNRVLEPIGIKLSNKAPVGRDSVKVVGDMVSKAYDHLKPKMSMVPDEEFHSGIAEIRNNATELPPAEQGQLDAILKNRVEGPLAQTGRLDGQQFKDVESHISTQARNYKSSPDPAQRALGEALEDVNGVLRDNLERTSEPGIRDDLKKVNTSWALLTRLEDAAQARKAGGGIITPGDLLGSVRKMDRTVRHRTFARGDAMMQQFGEDASDVLGNKLPDSGSAERLQINHNALLTYLASKVTNPAASKAMDILKATQPHVGGPENNLMRLPSIRRAPVLSLENLTNLPNSSQGQQN